MTLLARWRRDLGASRRPPCPHKVVRAGARWLLGLGRHVDALEQGRDQDGDADRDGGADGEDDLQP
jgi:hypothetical protein